MTLVDRSWLETCNQCGSVLVPESKHVHQQWHEWLARQFSNMFDAAERLDSHQVNLADRLDGLEAWRKYEEAQADVCWHEVMERSERD